MSRVNVEVRAPEREPSLTVTLKELDPSTYPPTTLNLVG